MNKKQIIGRALIDSIGTIIYISLISFVLNNGERIFGEMNEAIAPVVFLTLFVFSALVTSLLILGKPIVMYLDGQKKEAISLILYTSGALFVLLALGLTILIAIK